MIKNDSKERCFYCERPFNVAHYGTNKPCAQTRDHIIPISLGGTNHSRNMVYACTECNSLKSSLSLPDFVILVEKFISKDKGFKTVPFSRLHTIVKNANELHDYVVRSGRKLYKEFHKAEPKAIKIKTVSSRFQTIANINKSIKKQIADAHLSVNGNTRRQSSEEILYLQSQTVEQFNERKELAELRKILDREPEPNFHYL